MDLFENLQLMHKIEGITISDSEYVFDYTTKLV